MRPHPLARVLANEGLEPALHVLRRAQHVGVAIVGARNDDLLDPHFEMRALRAPHAHGVHRHVLRARDQRGERVGHGGAAEERHRHAAQLPEIRQEGRAAALPDQPQHAPRRRRRLVIEAGGIHRQPLLVEPAVDERVGEGLIDARHRRGVAQADAGEDFPVAHVERAHHEGRARGDGVEALGGLQRDAALPNDLGHVEEFGEGAAQIFPHAEGGLTQFRFGKLGIGPAQVVQRALLARQPRRDTAPAPAGERRRDVQRERRQDPRDKPKTRVFQTLAPERPAVPQTQSPAFHAALMARLGPSRQVRGLRPPPPRRSWRRNRRCRRQGRKQRC